MKRAGRRFDLFVIGVDDVERMGAWKAQHDVRFTFAQSRRLRRVRKRNTFLFDALTDIAGLPYRVSEGVSEDMLYEAVLVDFDMKGHVRCDAPEDVNKPRILPATDLQETLYRHGFRITSPQGQEIHFVPFVASASMSREEEYLFVNSQRLDQLLRAVSLDMVSTDPQGKDPFAPVLNGAPVHPAEDAEFAGLMSRAKVASVPKLAAYMGLALSDGVSLRERWAVRHDGQTPPRDVRDWSEAWMLGLNAHNTVCVSEWETAPAKLDAFDYCWVNAEAPRRARKLSSDTVSTQTLAQQTMSQLMAALARLEKDRDAQETPNDPDGAPSVPGEARRLFNALTEEDWANIALQWQSAIDSFMKDPATLELPLSLIPQPQTGKQGKSMYWYALIYAMCLYADEGRFILYRDEGTVDAAALHAAVDTDAAVDAPEGEDDGLPAMADEPATDAVMISAGELKQFIHRLQTEKELRNRLWNMLNVVNPNRHRLIEVKGNEQCVRVTLCWRPCARFRAKLRRISRKDRYNSSSQYDGCGFLDDELFDRLEELLRGSPRPADAEPLNAVQVRLPWCKGLLVRFTAAEYFRTWAVERGYSVRDLQIRDAFGSLRPVCDGQGRPVLRAVFTTSMFKGAKWFEALEKRTEQGDLWAEYWRRLHAHGASMLIAGKSTQSGSTSRLNYQFLSTMGLSGKVLRQMIVQPLSALQQAQEGARAYGAQLPQPAPETTEPGDVRRMARALLGMLEQETEEEQVDAQLAEAGEGRSEDEEESRQEPSPAAKEEEPDEEPHGDVYILHLADALQKHPEQLVNTGLIRSRFTSLVRNEVLQLMRGRLPVQGDVRYLLPDLLQMVDHISGEFLCPKEGEGAALQPCGRTTLMQPAIDACTDNPYGYYYAPGENAPWIRRSADPGMADRHLPVAILRNPHYGMGEEPVLQPLAEEARAVYESWFSQLRGCVMTSAAVMYTINGADCDGDRVNVCADERVVSAITRRAYAESKLLVKLIRRRNSLVSWLEKQLEDKSLHRTVREYLALLRDELPAILPKNPDKGFMPRSWLPPLVYAGSTARGDIFSRADLQSVHLKDKLWKTFRQASRQRIGMMSLEVLRLTADAYGRLPASDGARMDDRELLGQFVARYLVVCKALDTAMEIDMAKTGMSCDRHEIKASREEVRRYFGLSQASGFYIWRKLHKKYQKQLKGYSFDQTLEKLMREFCEKWKPAESGALMLDQLPAMVYSLWAPERAAEIGLSERLPATGGQAAAIREKTMMKASGGGVRPRLCKPDGNALALLGRSIATAADGQPVTLMERLKAMVIRYDRERRTAAHAQEAGDSIAAAYRSVMQWLIRSGRGLDEALEAMQQLQAMIDRWYTTERENASCLQDVFACLQEQVRRQALAVQWGWSDDASRALLLDVQLAEACERVDPARTWHFAFTDAERALLAGSRRSTVLVNHVMTYAWNDAILRRRAGMGCAMSLEELEERLRDIIAKAAPEAEDPDEIYYAACYSLFGATYADATGRQLQMMSEFLMTYLLRDMLSRKVMSGAGKEAAQ